MATIVLKDRRAKPFFHHHPWVFSGAVAHVDGAPRDGEVVELCDASGRFVAWGFYNSRSQIRVRLISWDHDDSIDAAFVRDRIARAIRLRSALPDLDDTTNAYRLVHSESDGLPGLMVDRYADFLVTQFLSAGMDRLRREVVAALVNLIGPRGIYDRSDARMRIKEGLPPAPSILHGEVPPGEIEIMENGLRFLVDLGEGQKTGAFLDQRANRRATAAWCAGKRVLDCFCFTGAFAVYAAAAGAAEVLGIDESDAALRLARRNAELNGCSSVLLERGDVFVRLREIAASADRFDVVVLDPPKFAPSKANIDSALRGLNDINRLAMQCLADGGILVTCSCSQHVHEMDFEAMLNAAAVDARRTLQILERRSQGADHPVIAACPETRYLKCCICRVSA